MEGLISTVLNKQDKVNKSVTNDNIFNQSGQSVLPNSKNAKSNVLQKKGSRLTPHKEQDDLRRIMSGK